MRLAPARVPTMYFIGVTTTQSMIMRVFPKWAHHLGLGECRIRGIDLALHDDPARYRQVVSFIKSDPLSLGALVTTHKIDLLRASRDLFDGLDDFAALMGEASSISKQDGRLLAGAKDPITSGLALDDFLPAGHWAATGAHAIALLTEWKLYKDLDYARILEGMEKPAFVFDGRAILPAETGSAARKSAWIHCAWVPSPRAFKLACANTRRLASISSPSTRVTSASARASP